VQIPINSYIEQQLRQNYRKHVISFNVGHKPTTGN